MNDRANGSADAKKGRRTQRRTVALGVRRTRAATLREWLQDGLGLAQKRAAAVHKYPNRAMRRSGRGGGVFVRNTPYVNLSRDAKPGRRLRGDER